jgi:hypothetical protein
VVATLAKTLLPLGLMALIMYARLYFPVALVEEKVTVAITGALSGAVLLASINSQLGNIGYVIAVELVNVMAARAPRVPWSCAVEGLGLPPGSAGWLPALRANSPREALRPLARSARKF